MLTALLLAAALAPCEARSSVDILKPKAETICLKNDTTLKSAEFSGDLRVLRLTLTFRPRAFNMVDPPKPTETLTSLVRGLGRNCWIELSNSLGIQKFEFVIRDANLEPQCWFTYSGGVGFEKIEGECK